MDQAPKHAIPIKAEVLVLYLSFKFWDETKELLDLSNESTQDGKGKAIKCMGQQWWKDPDDHANQLHSTMECNSCSTQL
jgi:hypothetical protein